MLLPSFGERFDIIEWIVPLYKGELYSNKFTLFQLLNKSNLKTIYIYIFIYILKTPKKFWTFLFQVCYYK